MFRKYPSLTNHYMEFDLKRFCGIYEEEMEDLQWHVGEKIHGANISILFRPNETPRYFSRNQDITDEMFYGAGEVFEATRVKMQPVQQYVDMSLDTVRHFGELFGASVQKGVDYGNVKRILFYDVVINDLQQTVETFEQMMTLWQIRDLVVPVFGIFDTFEEALAINTEIDSVLLPEDPHEKQRMLEGMVIKPYNKVLEDINGSLFYVKKKNEAFKEAQSVKKARTVTQYTEEVNNWRAVYLSYLHPERIESVFSKEGRMESMSEMGRYIKLVAADMVETFFKEEPDYPVEVFTKSEQSYIINISKEIVKELKEGLKNG